jgi:hypothetical protein
MREKVRRDTEPSGQLTWGRISELQRIDNG